MSRISVACIRKQDEGSQIRSGETKVDYEKCLGWHNPPQGGR
jgi:hypothetical protein